MKTDKLPEEERPEITAPQNLRAVPAAFNVSVFATFSWIVVGISIIYGVRLWWDNPIDPSFVPFVCVGFGVIVAFAIVLTLSYATGDIEFEAPGFKFKGASGPILLWIMCFLAILFGFYLVGITEVFKTGPHRQVPLQELGPSWTKEQITKPSSPPSTSGTSKDSPARGL